MTWPCSRYAAGVFAALIILVALAAYIWPVGFTAIAVLMALFMLPLFRPHDPNAVFVTLLALAFVMICSLSWSPVYSGADALHIPPEKQTWGKLLIMLALYGVMVTVAAARLGPQTARLQMLFAVSALVLSIVMVMDALGGAVILQRLARVGGHDFPPAQARNVLAQGVYAQALMLWPAWAILWARGWRAAAVMLGAATVATAVILSAMAPVLAVLAGGLVYLLARRSPAITASATGVAMATMVVAAPWAVIVAAPHFDALSTHVGASWAARLELWRYGAERVVEHPFFGWGLDGSRLLYGDMLHPHSGLLQIWIEMGVLGAVLMALMWLLLAQRAGKLGPHALATMTVYFVIGALSFSLWKEWWLALAPLACVWAVLARHDEEDGLWDIEA